MTNAEKITAISELAQGLSAKELRDLYEDFEDMADEVAKVECEKNGHQIDNDHCGRPEHRFCRHCWERETEIQARQAKGDEAAASKAAST